MPVTISAVFDTVDLADLARIRLRGRGVEYGECEAETQNKASVVRPEPFNVIVNPFMPITGAPVLQSYTTLPANAQLYGGVIMNRSEPGVSGIAGDLGLDGSNESALVDVKMKLRVRNDQAALAEGILTSCHGTQVRRG